MNLLVESTIKVSLLLILGFVAAGVLRRRSAALRHWVLSTALVCAALVPAAGRVLPAWHVPLSGAGSPLSGRGDDVTVTTSVVMPASAPARPIAADAAPRTGARGTIVGAWIAGAATSLLLLLVGFVRLRRLAARCQPVTTGPWAERLTVLAAEQGVARPVRLLQGAEVPLLVTWGSRSPAIMFPRDAAAWPDDRIAVVLRHELAHIRRGDWLTQTAAEIVRSVYWFNPLIWIACARIRQESEHACDDAVLGAGVAPTDYAAHLVDLARALAGAQCVRVPAQRIVRPSKFEKRVTAMLNARVNRSPMSPAGRVAAGAAILVVGALVAAFAPGQNGTVFSGTIVDAMGRPLGGTKVTLADTTLPSSHEVVADALGKFAFVPLPPGDYSARVSRLGFAPLEERVTLNGDSVQRAITLQLDQVSESVRITDAALPAPAAPPPAGSTAAGKIAPPPPPAPLNWEELRDRVRAKRAHDPCAQSSEGGCLLAPLKVKDVKPVFPPSLKGTGTTGVVVLKATIATDGSVQAVQVVSSPNTDFSDAAVAAVRQWQFEPTHLDGVIVETPMTIRVAFETER